MIQKFRTVTNHRIHDIFFYVFVIAIVIFNIVKANTCHKTAIVTRTVNQNGFHRMLQTRVVIPWNLTGCQLLLEEKLPAGVYVDPDELERLKDLGSSLSCLLEQVDIEAFESNSKPLRVYSYSRPLPHDQTDVIIELPVHVRYHQPRSGGESAVVSLPQPSLLASCPSFPGEAPRSCPGWSEGPAPCPHCSSALCDWIHLPYSSAQLELRLNVPVGNADHTVIVMAATALTLVLATTFLLWTVQTSAKKNR